MVLILFVVTRPERTSQAHRSPQAPRHLAVLELAAQKAGWEKPLPAGRFRGIAVLFAFESYAAQVVGISVNRAHGR